MYNYLEFITEALQNVFYHATTVERIISILQQDKINLSTNINKNAEFIVKPFYLSLSRTGHPGTAFGTTENNFARLVLDGNKLLSKYKRVPFNYYKFMPKGDERKIDEYEDRLGSDVSYIPDAKKYILRVEVLYEKHGPKFERNLDKLFAVCHQVGVPIEIYETRKDLVLRKNSINHKFVVYPVEDNIEKAEAEIESMAKAARLAIYVFTIMYYDDKYTMSENFDELKADFEKWCDTIDPTEKLKKKANVFELSSNMRSISFGDTLMVQQELNSAISSVAHTGTGGIARKILNLLAKDMRKCGTNHIHKYCAYKLNGVKPMVTKFDYAKDWNLYRKTEDGWTKIPNSATLSEVESFGLSLTNTHGYMGITAFAYAEFENKMDTATIGELINHMMNRYVSSKVVQWIEWKSTYYGDGQMLKLDKS